MTQGEQSSSLSLADELFVREEFVDALKKYEEVLESGPLDPQASINLGICYLEEGGDVKAEEIVARVLKRCPKNFRVMKRIGDYYRLQERWDRAARIYFKASNLNPNDKGVQIGLGVCYRQLKQSGCVTITKKPEWWSECAVSSFFSSLK